jgi:hypothetical protein
MYTVESRDLLPVIACVCLSILSDRTKDVLSDMPSFETCPKLVCHSSVPHFWSDPRAANSKANDTGLLLDTSR